MLLAILFLVVLTVIVVAIVLNGSYTIWQKVLAALVILFIAYLLGHTGILDSIGNFFHDLSISFHKLFES